MSPRAAVSALANFGLLAPISAEADLEFWKAPCLGGPFLANVSRGGSVGGGIALAGGVDLAEEGFIGVACFLDLVGDVGRDGGGRGGSGGVGFVTDPTEAVSWRQHLPMVWCGINLTRCV